MRIFVSWSGTLSKVVANNFRTWLKSILQNVDVFVSSEDITKGSRWFSEIAKELEKSDYGIVCLTKENVQSPWIFFEVGALSKKVSTSSFVCPLLIDITPSELIGPLAQFQALIPTKEEMYKLIKTINGLQDIGKLEEVILNSTFNKWWSDFESQLNEAKKTYPTKIENIKTSQRDQLDILEEILQLTRGINQSITDKSDVIQSDEQTKAQFLNAITQIKLSNRKLPCNLSLVSDIMKKSYPDFNISNTKYSSFVELAKYFEENGVIKLRKDSDRHTMITEISM